MESEHDTNNNTTAEKSYSLRPRTSVRREDQEADQEDVWKPRGRTRKKPKQKSVPLSKYRRKTANARERFRMREINEAFEALRRAIPHLSSTCENPNEKLTKISTLRLAMKYITALNNALQDSDLDSDADSFFSEWTSTPPDLRESSTPSSVNDHSDLYDQFFSPSPSSESPPPTASPYSLSSILTPPTCEFPPSVNHVLKVNPPPIYSLECSSSFRPQKDERLPSSSTSLMTSPPLLERCSLTSPGVPENHVLEDDLSHHFLTTTDLQGCAPSFLDELEGLPSPTVNLEDYLIT